MMILIYMSTCYMTECCKHLFQIKMKLLILVNLLCFPAVLHGSAGAWHQPVNDRCRWDHSDLCSAHVEGDSIHWHSSGGYAGVLGGFVDDLCQ